MPAAARRLFGNRRTFLQHTTNILNFGIPIGESVTGRRTEPTVETEPAGAGRFLSGDIGAWRTCANSYSIDGNEPNTPLRRIDP